MKSKLILTAVLSAMLLTGCNKKTELIDDLEISESTLSAQSVQNTETENKIIETDGETQYIFGGETETTNTNENEIADNAPESSEPKVLLNVFDYGSLNPDTDENENTIGDMFIKDNILFVDYNIERDDIILEQLRFYDIAENKLLAAIDLPEGWFSYEMISEVGGDVLCKQIIFDRISDESPENQYAVMTIYNDFTYDISDGYTVQNGSFECRGHNIAELEPDIVDADSGEILVEGRTAESDIDFSGTRQIYYFPLDDNRFVYRTAGYESLPSFGIYDFSNGTATDVPDSRDLVPLGVHGGKIYSIKTAWDGFGTELYITDPDTLETEFFMDCPIELEMNDFVEYAMPESGNYIALKYLPVDEEAPAQLYGINPDTKEFIAGDIPDDLKYYSLYRSTGNRVTVSNNHDRVLIAEIEV